MKNLITVVLLLCGFAGYSQDTTRLNKDTEYGTLAERVHQESIERQSHGHYLCRLIGFKGYYLNKIATYLQVYKDFTLNDTPDKQGYFVYDFSKNMIYMGKVKPPKMILTFAVDKSERIKSGVINGRFNDLADLFINYWPMDAEWNSEMQLKRGVVAQKHSFGDLITFNWSGITPYIKVTKDPNISIPVPPLNN